MGRTEDNMKEGANKGKQGKKRYEIEDEFNLWNKGGNEDWYKHKEQTIIRGKTKKQNKEINRKLG